MLSITTKEFRQLSDYIKNNYGIYLKEEKMTLLTGRLQHVLTQAGFSTFTEYYNHIVSDGNKDSLFTLVDKITTNHTYFMREADHFDYFRSVVLPYLRNTVKNRDLRIWCAACSTGEEPYTLAMILDEFFGNEKSNWDKRLLATDISGRALDIAKTGVYEAERIHPLPSVWKLKYFEKTEGRKFTVADRIKNEVFFRRFNLMEPVFPFKRKFHVVFLRNVMIYFDNDTKNALIGKMYESMEEGGYLFIGHSETLNKDQSRFKYVRPAVYRKE